MHSEILNLIDLAIADGNITEKERAVILRKANALGEDADEVELILEGKLAQARRSDEQHHTKTSRDGSVTGGQITRCPACNAAIGAFTTRCPDCGHEFRDVQASFSVQKLYDELQRIDEQERSRKRTALDQLLDNFAHQGIAVSQSVAVRQAAVISAFPIPNTKEDLLEFLAITLSESKRKISFSERWIKSPEYTLKKAWLAKAQQLITKARLSMGDDKTTLAEVEKLAKQLDK